MLIFLAAARHKPKASPEQLRARLELRRSNAARPHRNRKKYDRNDKSWEQEEE